ICSDCPDVGKSRAGDYNRQQRSGPELPPDKYRAQAGSVADPRRCDRAGVSKPGAEQHRRVERLEPGAARIAAITAFNIRTARDDAKTDARIKERNRPAGFARK